MKNEQQKRYRLINGQPYEDDNIGVYDGEIYPEHFIPERGESIRDYVAKFPQDWELVTDEPEPFTPTHEQIGGLIQSDIGAKVSIVKQHEGFCEVTDDGIKSRLVNNDDIKPLNTTLTEQQHNSLIQSIATAILNSNNEFGMGDAAEAHETAAQTVRQWAEENRINLP